MQNSEKENQDQRTTCNMEESAMTIEFLRARLLSERSVSKSARQRADELAKMVAELEEQLKFVSFQRRRAEMATADVLAILENNGISDISEDLDSYSDHHTPFESIMVNGSAKEEETSVSSKLRRKDSDEFSGSDFDFSPVSGRSLSWKFCTCANHSPERYKDSFVRRHNSFLPMGFSSQKQRQGKSCQRIRRRESRSVADVLKSDNVKVDTQVNEVVNSSKVDVNQSEGGSANLPVESEICESKKSMCNSHLDGLRDETETGYDLNFHGYKEEKNMEKALEHQAQLIGRYEAMEKAQREWEEKFRENNNGTLDSCDPGNHSDVTEERDEMKMHAQYASATAISQVQVVETEQISFSAELPNTNSNVLHSDHLQDQGYSSSLSPESRNPNSAGQNCTCLIEKENNYPESLQISHSPSHSSNHFAHLHASTGNQAVELFSSETVSNSCKEPLGNGNELGALVPLETSSRFTGVLNALKQARVSLQKRINTVPLIEGASVGKAVESSGSGRKVAERIKIPVGCSGFFRLPTDFSVEAPKVNFLGSDLQISLANYYPDTGVAPIGSNHLFTTSYMNTQSSSSSNYLPVIGDGLLISPYTDTRSSFSTVPTPYASSGYIKDDQLPTSRYTEAGLRISAQKMSYDPYFEPRLPSSDMQNYPTFPLYPDMVPLISSKEAYPAFQMKRSVGVPPDEFSFYDNHFRPDIHRL